MEEASRDPMNAAQMKFCKRKGRGRSRGKTRGRDRGRSRGMGRG